MREILSIAANSNVILWSNRKDAFSRSVIFENFDPKIAPSSQNWILTRVIEVKICDRTYGLGAICFLVLVPKPLVLSKNCTAQTPLKIQFCLLGVIFGSKLAKITAGAQILGNWKFTQNLPWANLKIVLRFLYLGPSPPLRGGEGQILQ